MNMKKIKTYLKYLLGFVRVKISRISVKTKDKIYIAKDVNIKGGENISLGHDVCVRPSVDLWCNDGKIEIGSGTEIGERSRISIAHRLTIGDKVLISPNVYITDCDHAYEDVDIPVIDQGIVNRENGVVVKEHSYIGINSVIVGNVTIGKHCVIGANSVVTKSLPDYCVAVGVPAKIIKQYNFITECWEKV